MEIIKCLVDVIALRTRGGSLVCTYKYDSWGKLVGVYNSAGSLITDTTNVALVNPIRYRGYYYDTESGLYYLGSRYYDPQMYRFLNADSILSLESSATILNLFTYCENNPVNKHDIDGNSSIWSLLTWPGQIHREVQEYIQSTNTGIDIEVGITKNNGRRGRIDLMDLGSGEIWEVKPISRAHTAKRQAESYLAGSMPNLTLGSQRFFGEFPSKSGNFMISYQSPEPGVVTYDFHLKDNLKDPSLAPVAVATGAGASIAYSIYNSFGRSSFPAPPTSAGGLYGNRIMAY